MNCSVSVLKFSPQSSSTQLFFFMTLAVWGCVSFSTPVALWGLFAILYWRPAKPCPFFKLFSQWLPKSHVSTLPIYITIFTMFFSGYWSKFLLLMHSVFHHKLSMICTVNIASKCTLNPISWKAAISQNENSKVQKRGTYAPRYCTVCMALL